MLSGSAILFLTLVWGTREGQTGSQMAECGFACSEGVSCKNKVNRNIFNSFCRQPSLSVTPPTLESLTVSTAMDCVHRGGCALYLTISASFVMEESLRGLEICLLSLDTQETRCHSTRIPRVSSQKMAGRTVQVHFDCFEVSVAQHLYVTLKTIPYYCGVQLSHEYHVEGSSQAAHRQQQWVDVMDPKKTGFTLVEGTLPANWSWHREERAALLEVPPWSGLIVPDCSDADMRRSIPACFAGRLNYHVDPAQKAIEVHLADFPRGQPYYVRLCLKWFACEDYSPPVLVNTEQPGKAVALKYSQLLPCLCIEGWAAVPDAVRVQICPFENDTSILWDYIFYNPFTQSLSWEPPCPVRAEVHLCGMSKMGDLCWELGDTSRTVLGSVNYLRVDPQPELCMKFTTLQGSWVRCPFAEGNFPGWEMTVHQEQDKILASFISRSPARFQVQLCNRTSPFHCHVLESISVGSQGDAAAIGHVDITEEEACSPEICIQGWRTDVDYSVPEQMCGFRCNRSHRKNHQRRNDSLIPIHQWGRQALSSP